MKELIYDYLKDKIKFVSENEIIKKFSVLSEDKIKIKKILYNLEYEGKIIKYDDLNYYRVPKEFIYKHGIVKKSNKGNLFIESRGGYRIFFNKEDEKKLKEHDAVFYEIVKELDNKFKYECKVYRIVKYNEEYNEKKFIKAIINKTGNCYYIEDCGKKYFIDRSNLNGAFEGDEVSVFINTDDKNSIVKVNNIVKRKSLEHVLKCKIINGEKKFIAINTSSIPVDVDIDYNKYNVDDMILVNIDESNNATYLMDLEYQDKMEELINISAFENQIPITFGEKVLEECEKLDSTIDFTDRVDLRNLTTFTIDGDNAKDLDDAISIEYKDNRFYLYVSIADVSHYVKMDSEIFKEASKRGTSIYPVSHVIPMLPEKLSNELCSLNPHTDKLTKTCKIEILPNGEIVNYEVFKSVINSNCRMTYSRVNSVLSGNRNDTEYEQYFEKIYEMNILSMILQKRRLKRGYINFQTIEDELIINEEGKVVGIYNDHHGPAELLIENFMLLANECIANYAHNLNIPFVYRNHEAPSVESIIKLKNKLEEKKIYVKNLKNSQNPKVIQNYLDSILKDRTEEEKMIISEIFLKSMQSATYNNSVMGHYGLALSEYATFTSPIRRLPDLLNHTMLDLILEKRFDELEKYGIVMERLSAVSTETQKRAEEFERGIYKKEKYKFLNEFIGVELEGKIQFIQDNLVYIKTKNNFLGYIKVNKDLIKNNYVKLAGELYTINDDIIVEISSISDLDESIEFKVSNSPTEKYI